MQKNKKKKKNNIEFLLEEPLFYLEQKLANGGNLNKDGKLSKQNFYKEGNEERQQNIIGQGMNSQQSLILKGTQLPIQYDREYLVNESGEKFIRNEFGNFNVSNDDANNKLNYYDYIDNLKFIEQHGVGPEEFYKEYPDEDTYYRNYPKDKPDLYALGGKMYYNGKRKYALGGGLWGNSNLNADPYAPIGQIANMAGTMGAGILDNAIEDQHQRINVEKETGMGILKGAGQGAALGANPMLAAATGGLSIAAGAVIGGIGGGLISHKNAKKNAQANHDALIEQYYGNNPTTFAYGGPLKRKQIAVGEYPSHLNPDGSYSNEVSMSFSDDEGSWLIPTFFNGTINPQRESVERFYNSGEYLGHFKNDNDAIKGSIDREKLNQINPKGQNGYPTPRKSRENNSLENYSSYFADGGNLGGDPKKLASNQASTQDSLNIYNNAKAVHEFYKKNGYSSEVRDISDFPLNHIHNANDQTLKDYIKDGYLTEEQITQNGRKVLPLSNFRINLDENRYAQREHAYGILNTDAPMTAYDRRIQPSTATVYRQPDKPIKELGSGFDVANVYSYDPIAVKPWHMSTDAEKKIKVEKYGFHPNDGTPPAETSKSFSTYTKAISAKPAVPPFNPKTADKLESRSPNMLDNDLPIRENNFQMDYSLPNMPKMDKFYIGMDDKNEALRQAGKPYKAKNAQGHILNIVSGDLNRNKPSEGIRDGGSQRIGYDRGNASMYANGGQMNNNPNQFGNQMSVFQGNKHEQGGIPLAGAEVEGGEVKWNDYIFSDRLETEKGSTFASIAKRIKNKYKGRENDKLANDSMEIELTKLMKANESARLMKEEMNQASHLEDLKKYGGFVDLDGDGAIKYANGGRMEIARAARKAGLSPEKFAKHLINAKIKYADGGPFKFKYDNYDQPFPVDAGPFRGSIGNYGESADPFGNFQGDNSIDFTDLGNYPMLNSNNIPSYNEFAVGNFNPNLYNTDGTAKNNTASTPTSFKQIFEQQGIDPTQAMNNIGDKSKDYLRQLGINDPTQPSYIPKFDPFVGSDQGYNFDEALLPDKTKSKFEPTVKRSDQLPQRPSYEPGSLDEFLAGYGNTPTTNNQKGSNNFGYAEAGLVASNLAGVDNFIKSLKPAQTKFDRINLDELDLSEARLMNARNQAQGLRQSQGNIRNNASSSGQALSNLAANNAALTEQKMNADLSTYLQENQTNVGIRNQEKSANNQIGREEYIANEQNRANSQSVGNVALANIGNNTQGYFRDKVMTKADDQQNARMQEIINGMGFNYKWGTDPTTDQYIIQFISKGGK